MRGTGTEVSGLFHGTAGDKAADKVTIRATGHTVLAPEEFAARMEHIAQQCEGDPERGHAEADDLLCDTLAVMGYEAGIGIFKAMDKWYA